MPINQPLHLRIEVLHSYRDSGEAETVKQFQLFTGGVAGMDLDRRFKAIPIDLSGREYRFENLLQIFFGKERRRAAAQVQAQQRAGAQRRNAIEIEIPFSRKQLDLTFLAAVIAGDHSITSAKRTKRFAKR